MMCTLSLSLQELAHIMFHWKSSLIFYDLSCSIKIVVNIKLSFEIINGK